VNSAEGIAIARQGDPFCNQCLASFFAARVCDGDVLVMRCPMREPAGTCSGVFPEAMVEAMLGETAIGGKYRRLRKKKQNEHNRECPRCGAITLGSPTTADMSCGACAFQFCFHHAAAHSGVPCARYAARREGIVVSTQSGIWKWIRTKRCPHCHVCIEKVCHRKYYIVTPDMTDVATDLARADRFPHICIDITRAQRD
jgi:ribosomal protein S27AE